MKTKKKYRFEEFPSSIKEHVRSEAAKQAGWKSPTDIGNGSSIAMEWLTYSLTMNQWIFTIQKRGITLSEEELKMLKENN